MGIGGGERPVAKPDLSHLSGWRLEATVEDYVYEDEAEKSLAGAIENSCIICSKPFGKGVRVMIPRYMLERDYYYRNNYVRKRFMCLQCYSDGKAVIDTGMKDTAKPGIRSRLARSMIRGALLKGQA